jgi:hypothetical protein
MSNETIDSNKSGSTGAGLIAAGYAIAAFLTFGYVFNENYVEPTPVVDCGVVPKVMSGDWDAYWNCRKSNIEAIGSGTTKFDAGFPAAYAAVLWPLYWGAHLGIKVTK